MHAVTPLEALPAPMPKRTPVASAGRPACGKHRQGPASCGDFRSIRVRDLRGMGKKPAVDSAIVGNKNMPICRYFTGATGLEPATSGVTGRRSNQLNYAPEARRPL